MSNTSSWDGKISNLKISPHSFPELYAELSSMHHKERSDRLRVLALLGMCMLKGGGGMNLTFQPPVKAEDITTEHDTKDHVVQEKKAKLKDKLTGSLKVS